MLLLGFYLVNFDEFQALKLMDELLNGVLLELEIYELIVYVWDWAEFVDW